MQGGDQGEQAARGRLVDLDLVGQARGEQLGALVVQRGALAVDRLDLARAGGANRRVIGLADEEIVFQQRPERRHRDDELDDRIAGARCALRK